ncbi:MAG: S-methyl-5'-thioadenosine phosphorylase [Bacteriovoracaceae bacterium]|nr:S-methyl-5'-thioadenosine phosphorylase [Bacteriovoracaceae bacterium]
MGVIGGTGVYQLKGLEVIKEHDVTTPFGKPSSPVIEAKILGTKFFFIPRHGKGHTLIPSEINYRANIFALKQIGVRYLISISAVGSLKEELPPTTFVLPDQFIDWTKGKRDRSFFENGVVGHVSVANPIDPTLQNLLADSCEKVNAKFTKGGSYICIEGPQFSTRAESAIYRSFGASVIGMTNVPEAFLAKEAAMAYATIAMVTDYDCWKEEHCTTAEIIKVAKKNNELVQEVLSSAIAKLAENRFEFPFENTEVVMTEVGQISSKHKQMLEVILG